MKRIRQFIVQHIISPYDEYSGDAERIMTLSVYLGFIILLGWILGIIGGIVAITHLLEK